jgi:hypothetical protein
MSRFKEIAVFCVHGQHLDDVTKQVYDGLKNSKMQGVYLESHRCKNSVVFRSNDSASDCEIQKAYESLENYFLNNKKCLKLVPGDANFIN